jgi:hypothetical protein
MKEKGKMLDTSRRHGGKKDRKSGFFSYYMRSIGLLKTNQAVSK